MYEAYITSLKSVRKHSNADRLQVTTVFGNDVIVDMSYTVGQRVIYFPVDGQLGEEFANDNNLVRKKDENGNNIGGYLDPNKRNITALKLRGEKSDGLVLPIEVLEKYTDVSKLRDGDKITVLNGHEICKKYIPKRNQPSNTNNKKDVNEKELHMSVSYPFFLQHEDTSQLAYNQNAFKVGDTIYLTRKLHGTSFRVSNALEVEKKASLIRRLLHMKPKVSRRWKPISGTRRVNLRDFDGGYYGSNEFRRKYHDMFKDHLPKGMTVYGEIVGYVDENTPIMPKVNNSKVKDKAFTKQYGKETVFSYGCKQGENKCFVYRITMTNEDGVCIELPTEETMAWCERLGVEYVPLLEKFIYTSWEDLNERCEKYLDVPEPLANGEHIVEGVVVRIDNKSKFTAFKTKGFYFKVLAGIAVDSLTDEDIQKMDADLLSEA